MFCAQRSQNAFNFRRGDNRHWPFIVATYLGPLGKGVDAMITVLPDDVQAGLDQARKRALKKSSRLAIEAGDRRLKVLRFRDGGFAVQAEEVPHLRGLVNLYDGTRHLSRCLIVASEEDGGEVHYEVKQMTTAADEQPLDYERAENAPVGLIENYG